MLKTVIYVMCMDRVLLRMIGELLNFDTGVQQ
jgi:hypothetical protein